MITFVLIDGAGGGGGGGSVTWNPSDKSADIQLSGGNLVATKINAIDVEAVRCNTALSGKKYFEVVVDVSGGSGEFILIGIANLTFPVSGGPGQDTDSYGYYQDTGEKYYNNVLSAYGATYKTNGDVIGVAVDTAAGKIWWSKNGTWQNSGDPGAGTGEAFSGISGTFYPCVSLYKNTAPAQQVTGHFLNASLTYAPPSGFSSME